MVEPSSRDQMFLGAKGGKDFSFLFTLFNPLHTYFNDEQDFPYKPLTSIVA